MYGQHTVLAIAALQLSPGLYWLQGENGSGKTTFLKLLAGLVPFRGDASINAVSIHNQPTQYRQAVHYVEAEPLYPPYLTGLDLLHFHLITRRATATQLQTLTETFKLTDFMHKPVGTYSSGMIKRLSLALVFLGQPKVLLLDEPLVTLDAQSQVTTLLEMTAAVQQGKLVIFTSHQPPESTALPPYQTLAIANQTICFA